MLGTAFLFLLLFGFYVSFYPFSPWDFFTNPPLNFFSDDPSFTAFLSNLLRNWLHVLWTDIPTCPTSFHSLSSHVPFSCVIPRIPHLLFQSLFMLPPNSKKSFGFLVLYLLYNWFVLCVCYICGTVSEDFSSLHFPVVKQFFFSCWTDTPVTFVTHIWKASKCQISSVSNIKNIKRNFNEIRRDCFVSLVKQSWIQFWVFLSEFVIFNDPIEIQNVPPWMNWNSQRILFLFFESWILWNLCTVQTLPRTVKRHFLANFL